MRGERTDANQESSEMRTLVVSRLQPSYTTSIIFLFFLKSITILFFSFHDPSEIER